MFDAGKTRMIGLPYGEKQQLSYRQQIGRKLRTQAFIGRHKYYTVTLKSTLSVTQDHWKRNHWIDHTVTQWDPRPATCCWMTVKSGPKSVESKETRLF